MKNCTWKTSVIALGLSAAVSLGICCVLLYLASVAFGEVHKHPIAHPMSIAVGLISFFMVILLFCLYVKQRSERPSVKGVVLDVLLALVCLVPFFYAWAWVIEIARALV